MSDAVIALPETRGDPHKYIIAFAVVLAALMQVIDSSIVNVALPDMMGNLGASLDEIAWVSTGYILASVIVIPLTGWLGELLRTQALLRRLDHPVHGRRASSAARRTRSARSSSGASCRDSAAAR